MAFRHAIWLFLFVQFVLARGGKEAGGGGSETESTQGGDTVNGAAAGSTTATPTVTLSSTLLQSHPPPFTVISATSAQITTAPSSSAVSAPPITFADLSNATTCMPMTLSWDFRPALSNAMDLNEDMQLVVTNINVTQYTSSNLSSNDTTSTMASLLIIKIISNHTAMSLGTLNWTAVSVPIGWYIVVARPEYTTQFTVDSPKFFVTTGSSTSCIDSSLSKTHSTLSTSALAGTVVGSVVGVTALLGAFILPRLWRRGVPGHKAWKDKRGKLYDAF